MQPKLARVLRGQFSDIGERKRSYRPVRLDCPVKLVVGPEIKAPISCIQVVAA